MRGVARNSRVSTSLGMAVGLLCLSGCTLALPEIAKAVDGVVTGAPLSAIVTTPLEQTDVPWVPHTYPSDDSIAWGTLWSLP